MFLLCLRDRVGVAGEHVCHGIIACAGQLLFASAELRRERGIRHTGDAGAFAERLLVDTDEISEAFWATKWGAAMRDELDHAPFNPCALCSHALPCMLGTPQKRRCCS